MWAAPLRIAATGSPGGAVRTVSTNTNTSTGNTSTGASAPLRSTASPPHRPVPSAAHPATDGAAPAPVAAR